jgi:hypothetical protein
VAAPVAMPVVVMMVMFHGRDIMPRRRCAATVLLAHR